MASTEGAQRARRWPRRRPSMIDRASEAVANRIGRRSFLTRSAVVGSALVTAPTDLLMRPKSAYAAICSCVGQRCDCGSLCCDGYTEFCCAVFGVNACPSGSLTGGWWKADGSSFCGGAARYYMDCHKPCGGCACGSNGICSGSCNGTACGCARGRCDHRKAGCTHFRYGNCNNHIRCIGPIQCRVVTCTPPWHIEPSCSSSAVRTDNNTRAHHRPCLDPPLRDRVGVAVWREPTWYLRRALSSGSAEVVMTYGQAGDVPLLGDWSGDGVKTPGVRRGNTFHLRNSLSPGKADIVFSWGRAADVPLVGDWNGDGRDGVALRRGATWYLKNRLDASPHEHEFSWGRGTDVPFVGDWNGDRRDGIGLRRGNTWYLKNRLDASPHEHEFSWGRGTDEVVVGDWNRDGRDGVGIVRDDVRWYLKNRLDASPHERELVYGQAGDVHFAWVYGRR